MDILSYTKAKKALAEAKKIVKPATNLVPNASFIGNGGGWQIIGGTSALTSGVNKTTSNGTQSYIRATHSTTGYKPKKGDKVYVGMKVKFNTSNFTSATLNFRDWVTGALSATL